MSFKKILFLFLMLIGLYSYSAKRYWVGNGSNLNWNATANWSATSGGTSGASVPGTSDTVYFNGSGTGQCSINATVSVKRWEIESGYTDTIKQNTYAITIGTGGMILSGGVFWGGSANITEQGVFTLQGTNFKSTSVSLIIAGNYSFTSGSFSHNNGKVQFNGNCTISGSTDFYDLQFPSSGTGTTITVDNSSTFNVTNDYTHSGGSLVRIDGGTINLQGNIYKQNIYANGGGTGTININGTGNQYFYGESNSAYGGLGWFCNITINKSSGILYLKDNIALAGTWKYTAGTIDISTYSSNIIFPTGPNNYIQGKHSLNNLALGTSGSGTNTFNVYSGDTLTLTGNLSETGSGAVVIAGVINLNGDLISANTSSNNAGGGTGIIHICGTGSQTITGKTTIGQGRLCTIKINKPSGTLYFKDYISVAGNWEYVQGTCDFTAYSNTIVFSASSSGRLISGNPTFNNIAFWSTLTCYINTPTNDTLTINGSLNFEGTSIVRVESGVIRIKGDININNTYNATSSVGSGTLLICGTSNQTITGASTAGFSRLCNIKIKKASGTLIFKNIISVQGNWTYEQGTLDDITYSPTIVFVSNLTNTVPRTISGTHTLNKVSFNGTTYTSYNDIPSGDTLTISQELKIEGSGVVNLGIGTIKLKGDLTITNTGIGAISTGLIKVCGTGNQTITGSTTALQGKLCNVTIQKPSGTLTLKNYITLADNANWKWLSGNVDVTSYSSTVVFTRGTRTIQGKQSFNNLSFNSVNSASTNNLIDGDTITVNGELKIEGAQLVAINTGQINAKGDITINNTSTVTTTSTATIKICGTTNQTFTGSGTVLTGKVCKILVDKPSDTLKLSSIITYLGDWKYIRGVVSPGTSTVVAYNAATVSGANGAAYMPFNNFRIYNNTTTLNSALIATKDVVISSGATLNGNSKTIYVGGNWDNTGTFTYANTTVIFAGSTALGCSNQRIIKSNGTVNFNVLEINKPDGKVYLNCATQVNFRMLMKKGVLVSTATNLLSIPNGFSADKTYEGSDTSYVSGPLKKTGNQIFTFPLGDTTLTSGAYHPLSITAPSNATDAYTGQYFATNQTYGSTIQTDSLESISNCEYFTLTRNVGSSVVIPTIGWNSNSCNVYDQYDVCVAGWNGTQWNKLGKSDIFYGTNSGSISALIGLNLSAVPILIGNPKVKTITSEAVLKRKLDAGYYTLPNGFLKFKFDEEYVNNGVELDFKIYDKNRNVVLSSATTGINLSVLYKDNRYNLNVLTYGLTTGFYVLEVKDKKGEVSMLRFKI